MTKDELAEAISLASGEISLQPIDKKMALLYMDWLEDVPGMTNPRCIIYAAQWCSYSHLLVANFLTKAVAHGKDVNSLQEMYWLFHDSFAAELIMDEKKDAFATQARNLLQQVGDLDLSDYGVPDYDKSEEFI